MKSSAGSLLVLSFLLLAGCADGPRQAFENVTGIALPHDANLVSDIGQFDAMGDGERKLLFSSSVKIRKAVVDGANFHGYKLTALNEVDPWLPSKMVEAFHGEIVQQLYITEGARTTRLVLSDSHIFVSIVWI